MVGYDPDQKVVVPHYVHGVCGAASGFVTRFLTQPLDVCKIRFQLQFEPIKTGAASSKYRGITQAFQLIVREEGFSALWVCEDLFWSFAVRLCVLRIYVAEGNCSWSGAIGCVRNCGGRTNQQTTVTIADFGNA